MSPGNKTDDVYQRIINRTDHVNTPLRPEELYTVINPNTSVRNICNGQLQLRSNLSRCEVEIGTKRTKRKVNNNKKSLLTIISTEKKNVTVIT